MMSPPQGHHFSSSILHLNLSKRGGMPACLVSHNSWSEIPVSLPAFSHLRSIADFSSDWLSSILLNLLGVINMVLSEAISHLLEG